ncbi:MAG: hypothetical protein IJE05_05405 [Clostridia bacterium]|nr:hypothetical protein [Clostridia bacterium]
MNNWMEKYERKKDEEREEELNIKLESLLDFLDEAYRDKDRVTIIERILRIYEELRIEACDYNEQDYKAKKKELLDIRYKIMKKKHMEDKESESWNEYKKEELEEEEELDR